MLRLAIMAPGINFVFVGEQQVYAALEQRGVMRGDFVEQRETLSGALPLIIEVLQVGVKRYAQRLVDRGGGVVASMSESQAQREFGASGEIDLARERDIAVQAPSHTSSPF